MAKVLVTGGLGFIGSHTCVELILNGHEVVIVDNLINSKISVLENIEKISGTRPDFYQIDCRETDKLQTVFSKQNIDLVIHFAALKAVGESGRDALEYYNNNLSSLLSLLTVMEQAKVDKLIFSSSCTVYGVADTIPVTENETIKEAESVYGTTKIMAEKIISDISLSKFALKSVILRYFNPVGAHDSGLIGEDPNGVPTNLFPIILGSVEDESKSISIFGRDYDSKDGTAIRDYIHVMDLAKAHSRSINYLLDQKESVSYFNVGNGKGYTVLEVIQEFEKQIGRALNYNFAERRDGDLEKIWADCSLAKNRLNWEATYELSDMVKDSLKRNSLNK